MVLHSMFNADNAVSETLILIFAHLYTIFGIIMIIITSFNIADYCTSKEIKKQSGTFQLWYSIFSLILACDWIASGWFEYYNANPNTTFFLCMGLGIVETIFGTFAIFYGEGLIYFS